MVSITFTKILAIMLVASFHLQGSESANILFFWGLSGYSHRISVWNLVQSLANSGHNVTFFSPHKSKTPSHHPNITDVSADVFNRIGMGYDPAEIRVTKGVKGIQELWGQYLDAGIKLCQIITEDKTILPWDESSSYDLVIVNALFNDCALGYAWKFNVSTIVYSSSSVFPWFGETYGFPEENYPEFKYHLSAKMTFLEEVWNALQPLYWKLYRNWYYLPMIDSIIRPALEIPDMPSLEQMDKRNSLILLNTHFSEEFPRSFPPWVIPVGGMQCRDNTKPLPNELQEFIDRWEDGFVYFSFGTYMKLPLLPQRIRDEIFGAIRKFPNIGFVLKWNGGEPPNETLDNVFTSEWLPQHDILAHPKVRAFIAHGGLLGTQEAVFHAVPMIVFPIFAEQDYNAVRIHDAERGIMMEISELTQDKLENAIHEVLTNKKYKENMIKTSNVFKDRPQKPVELAHYWIEYVLKYKDTPFLKPNGLRKTWYQVRMLHIWGFLGAVVVTGLSTIYFSLWLYFSKRESTIQKVKLN